MKLKKPTTIWKLARLAQRKTLREVSQEVGISETYLYEIESGIKPGNIQLLAKLSKLLNVDYHICDSCKGRGWIQHNQGVSKINDNCVITWDAEQTPTGIIESIKEGGLT